MRSLMGLMAAAAQEQLPYDTLEHANPAIPNSRYIPRSFQLKELPRFSRGRPPLSGSIAALDRDARGPEIPPIVQVSYRGKIYRIADKKSADVADNQYWNRDVFRLINQLTSQVTGGYLQVPAY